MSDYKRMVSYMYEYENGVKKKNIGYTRIETKNSQIKFTIRLQLLGHLDSIFPVYLIQREKKEMNLIYLGDAVLKNQVMDSKLTADEINIMGSGYGLTHIGGMLLFLNDSIFFATEWDDKPIIADEVMEAMKPKQDKKSPEDQQYKELVQEKKEELPVLKEDIRQKPDSDIVEAAPEIEKPIAATEGQIAASIDVIGKKLVDEGTIPKYKLPRGWKTVERLHDPGLLEILRHSESLSYNENQIHNENQKHNENQIHNKNQIHNENPMPAELINKTVKEAFLQPSERGNANRTVFSEAAKARYASLTKGKGNITKPIENLKDPIGVQEIAEQIKEREEHETVKEEQVAIKQEQEYSSRNDSSEEENNLRKDSPEENSFRKDSPEENSSRKNSPEENGFRKDISEENGFRRDISKEDSSKEVDAIRQITSEGKVEDDIINQAIFPQEAFNPVENLKEPSDGLKANATEQDHIELVKQHLSEGDSAIADYMFHNYPRIYPFEDNEVILCVKIEPKDLGYLSKEAWSLSNNSFLLHGYYSYRHLIFAKMKDGYSHRYILGVPGIFHNREKLMARMFGFECFKSIRKRELRQGDYGYWYVVLTI